MNPSPAAQVVTVAILRNPPITRTFTVPARGRVAEELGTWGLQETDFGVEVTCRPVCAASLVMWDARMTQAHESIPVVGCVVK